MGRAVGTGVLILLAFAAGLFTQVLYQRWNPPASEVPPARLSQRDLPNEPLMAPGQAHRVTYLPLAAPPTEVERQPEIPLLAAREVDKIRALTGKSARVRGRVFRVGHSAKSNTYFLNFGPSREALTAVIFSSAVALFEAGQIAPKSFENKDVEITGQIKDHPQYGLEVILENPKQIRIVN